MLTLNPFANVDIRTHSFLRRQQDTFRVLGGDGFFSNRLFSDFNDQLGILDYPLTVPTFYLGKFLLSTALPAIPKLFEPLFKIAYKCLENPGLWLIGALLWTAAALLLAGTASACAIVGGALCFAGGVLKLAAVYGLASLLTLLLTVIPVLAIVHASMKGQPEAVPRRLPSFEAAAPLHAFPEGAHAAYHPPRFAGGAAYPRETDGLLAARYGVFAQPTANPFACFGCLDPVSRIASPRPTRIGNWFG